MLEIETAASECISLTFSYDINGILDVTAKVLSTGIEKNVVIVSNHNPLTEEEVKQRKKHRAKEKVKICL